MHFNVFKIFFLVCLKVLIVNLYYFFFFLIIIFIIIFIYDFVKKKKQQLRIVELKYNLLSFGQTTEIIKYNCIQLIAKYF